MKRRVFLQAAAAGVAAPILIPRHLLAAPGQPGANDRICADVEIAHRSSTVCHLVNIARELGRRLRWDPAKEAFAGDDQASRHPSVTRPRRKGYELPAVI